MATKVAQASGNWSEIAWLGGDNAVPGLGDVAQAGAFDVTLNINVSVTSLHANGVGQFLCSTARTIIANVINDGLVASALVLFHAAGTVTVTGNVTSTGADNVGIVNASTGTVTVTGNVIGTDGGSGINNASTGAVNVTGDVSGVTGS